MSDRSDTQSSSTNIRSIGQTFRLTGWISFWTQLVLGVIAGGILLFAIFSQGTGGRNNNPGTGFGVFFAFAGIVALMGGVFIAFRYMQTGRKLLSANPVNRPRKAETVQVLRLGMIVHFVGMLLTLFGAQAIIGTLFAKALTSQPISTGVFTQRDPSQTVQALDLLVVQANTNTITAHFAGLVASVWLLNRITR
ncbi:DUF3611 family protein [Mastigocoleus sp. MO_188.B34]|uniref:DUF3611 family protein n=1 Tax=Mastigocoleus sp. MO_188.B34 TaxID=3036635 RepID=UPI00261C63DC|nr:DUF3611 family protein [Mastigocoleus sp. MO_188.B34]MDJ0695344.1 DUF3611 family protein [Mastigocoleus sp. MO_188.B34]